MLLPEELLPPLVVTCAAKLSHFHGTWKLRLSPARQVVGEKLSAIFTMQPEMKPHSVRGSFISVQLGRQEDPLRFRIDGTIRPPSPGHGMGRESRYIYTKLRFSKVTKRCLMTEQTHYLLWEHPLCDPLWREFDFDTRCWEEI